MVLIRLIEHFTSNDVLRSSVPLPNELIYSSSRMILLYIFTHLLLPFPPDQRLHTSYTQRPCHGSHFSQAVSSGNKIQAFGNVILFIHIVEA